MIKEAKKVSKQEQELTGINARLQTFKLGLDELQKKHAVELYAVLSVQQNGEIAPIIKMRDVFSLKLNK